MPQYCKLFILPTKYDSELEPNGVHVVFYAKDKTVQDIGMPLVKEHFERSISNYVICYRNYF